MNKLLYPYDEGYLACPCLWGETPGSLVQEFVKISGSLAGRVILDAGCGEGKNAIFLARAGARILATDASSLAIANGQQRWPSEPNVTWQVFDVLKQQFSAEEFDVVVAYGLLHCLPSREAIYSCVASLQTATKRGGYNIICAFNSREQDLSAHPGFNPYLLDHTEYVRVYAGWDLVICTDRTLHETHPHNNIPHHHSLTRILAKKL